VSRGVLFDTCRLTAQSLTRLAAPGGPPGTPVRRWRNLIAYDLDRLFRAERRPQNTDLTYARSEAARILLTSAGYSGVSPEDRAYLVRLTASVTGAPDAEKRVDTVIAQARDNIRKARRSGVVLSLWQERPRWLGLRSRGLPPAQAGNTAMENRRLL
jgi:hypothetical protein